jgi:urea carboxylase-associated protein 1
MTAATPIVDFNTYDVAAEAPWSGIIRRGETIRIEDLHGRQAVDTLFYRADDFAERYSNQDTMRVQGGAYVTLGTRIISSEGNVMLTVTADSCGRHDISAGACSCESNAVRFGHDTRHQHACRDNFVLDLARHGMTKRDIAANINFFMNVPISPDGTMTIVDGISAPGDHVELRAEMDVLCVISNCPQINNPCNGFDPSAIRIIIRGPAPQ